MKKRRAPSRSTPASAPAAGTRAPTYDDILAIARLIESGSRFSEFRLRSGDIEVEVRRANGALPTSREPPLPGNPPAGAPASTASAANAGNWVPLESVEGSHVIRSPMVGTFYRAPGPAAPPFVEVGSRVEADTIVCIIEVMKLMNSVAAGARGVVTHVFVENAQLVEYGQPLVAVRPE